MARQVWADFAYSMQVRKQRERSLKWVRMRGSAPVGIEEVEAFDVPKAFVTARDRPAKENRWGRATRTKTWSAEGVSISPGPEKGTETVTQDQPAHGGRLYRRLSSPTERFKPCLVEQVCDGVVHGDHRDHPFVRGRDQHVFDRLPDRDAVLADVKLKETGIDGHDAAVARVSRAASDLLVKDGVLWQAQVEPFYVVRHDWRDVVVEIVRPSPPSPFTKPSEEVSSGVCFAIDRRDDAHEFGRAWAAGTKRGFVPCATRVLAHDPSFLTLDRGVATARLLTKAVLGASKAYAAHHHGAQRLLHALGGGEPGTNPTRTMGDPFLFANTVMSDVEGQLGRDDPFRDILARLAQPLRQAMELGYAPRVADVLDDDDMAALDDLAEGFELPSV